MTTILKIPFDKCIVEKERRGAEKAPDIIQKEFESLFASEEIKNAKWASVKVSDDFEKLHKKIEFQASKAYQKGEVVVGIGGDHSVSYSLVKAFFENHKNSGLIVFDAHLDCVHNFYPPTHEDWLRVLIEKKIVPKGKISHFGSRNNTKEEISFASDNLSWDSIEVSLDAVKEHIKEFLESVDSVYLSVDIDVLDPKFAPGTGWPEPAGILPQHLLSLLDKIRASKKIRGFDIVEVSPPRDINNITSRLAAKILLYLLK